MQQRVAKIVARARQAQKIFAAGSQSDIDLACLAAARPVFDKEVNCRLSEMAVRETGIGNAADKQRKNIRKTLGLLRDISGKKTVGVIRKDSSRGIIEIGRPVGVVAALTPSTNPVATPINKTVNALKGGNAIILAPPPAAAKTGGALLKLMRAELKKTGAPEHIVQMLLPPSKEATRELMRQADLTVATGSQRNVHEAYSSGTPAIGVGAGNVAVIVDETANLQDAAKKISSSKIFDNSTSCSSENHIVIVGPVYDDLLALLREEGGMLLNYSDKNQLEAALWQDGRLNRQMIARDMPVFAQLAGLGEDAKSAKFLMVKEKNVGPKFPFSGEKLSLTMTVYKAKDFGAAKKLAAKLLAYQGTGHSVGIHTQHKSRPLELGLELYACRIIVNQAHCFATGGSFENSLPFSLSMGCGTWGGNSINENLNYRHYLNIVRIVSQIPAQEASFDEIYTNYPDKA